MKCSKIVIASDPESFRGSEVIPKGDHPLGDNLLFVISAKAGISLIHETPACRGVTKMESQRFRRARNDRKTAFRNSRGVC